MAKFHKFHTYWLNQVEGCIQSVPLAIPPCMKWLRLHNLSRTVRCHYNVVNFLKNILGQGVGCLLWIRHLIDILSQFLQLLMQYLTILDHVIMALHCICQIHFKFLTHISHNVQACHAFHFHFILYKIPKFQFLANVWNFHHLSMKQAGFLDYHYILVILI